jgi:hypothetical protein
MNKFFYRMIIIFSVSSFVTAETIEVDFVYVGQKNSSAYLGAKQGIDEANLQGQFLNQKYNLKLISKSDVSAHDFSKYIAVLTSVDIDTFTKLSTKLPETPVFNLMIESDKLRTSCINNALHVIPSESMKTDALSQWKKKKPESKAKAKTWHPDFVKFAARDLNKRFKKNYKTPMDDFSWAGWAAIKMTSDAVARTNITDSKGMLNFLKTDLAFDGQKGSNMNFRKTGQLRQLLLLVEDNKIVAEAPVRGIAKPPTLDSLGNLDCE